MRSLLNLRDSYWAFSFNGFKSQLLSALEESFIVLTVVTERNTQFERWTEDNGQPQRREEFTWTEFNDLIFIYNNNVPHIKLWNGFRTLGLGLYGAL